MKKVAVVVYSDSDTPAGRGRMVHAMDLTKKLQAEGHDAKLMFHGIGVRWIEAFGVREHPFTQHYGYLYDAVKPYIFGACDFCSNGRFKVGDAVREQEIPLLGESGHHHELHELLLEGYQIVTF